MEKQRWEELENRKEEERRSEKRKSQKKEDPGTRQERRVAKHCVFSSVFVAPEGWQVGSLKPRVRSHLVRWETLKILRPHFFESLPKVAQKKDHRRETIAMPRFYGREFIAMLLDSTAEGL